MDIQLILTTNYPGKIWTLIGADYSGLEWLDKSVKPSEAELAKQWPGVQYQVEYDAVTVARHAAYTAPGGSDAVYMQYQRGEATEQEWLDAVQTINDANPYPVKVK